MRRVQLLVASSLFTLFCITAGVATQIHAQVSTAQFSTEQTEGTTPVPTATPSPTPLPLPTQAINLTVSPISVLLETDPGTQVTNSIRVLNNGTEAEHLTVELATFEASQDGSQPAIRSFTDTEAQKDWLTFSEKNITALPGEWKTVGLTFAPPPEAALSYYYAIIVKRQSDAVAAEGESIVTGAPAVLVLATVASPNARQELRLESFSTQHAVYEFLPTSFEVVIQNSGNVHLAPFGNVFIDSGSKKDIAALSVNAANGMVLPGSTRTYTISWNDGFPSYEPVLLDGKPVLHTDGTPKQKLHWDFSQMNKLRFGKYTAQLLMVYDNGERDVPVESTLSFWVIPWRFLVVALLIVVFVVLGILLSSIFLLRFIRSHSHARNSAR